MCAHVTAVFKQKGKTWVENHVTLWFISLGNENIKSLCASVVPNYVDTVMHVIFIGFTKK